MINSFPLRLTLHVFFLSSTAEYFFLRILSRMGPLFPESEPFSLFLAAVYQTGLSALNFAAITGLVLLSLWTIKSFTQKRGNIYPLPLLAALIISVAGFVLTLKNMDSTASALLPVMTGFSWLTMVLAFITWRRKRKINLLLLLFLLVYTFAYFQFWARQAFFQASFIQAKSLLAIAELLTILTPVMALLIYKPQIKLWALSVASFTGVFMFLFYWLNPGIAAALVMWNQSFTSYLPFPVYPLATGFYIYNILALFNSANQRSTAIGLALVALGGLRLEYAYFNLLALAGFLLLAEGSDHHADPELERA